jgi:alpha/beta superfamily hydrolase
MKRVFLTLLCLVLIACNNTQDTLPKRPQDPTTYPYKQEEVTFTNSKAGDKLAGTLTIPSTGKTSKIVVLITGSGPQNRNEEDKRINHRPFLVLSDWLTRNGIAVLRYDDRGVNKSTGVFATGTTADWADDAEAAVNYILSRPDLKGLSIGLIGHSEGGVIAPIVASRNNAINYICLLAGPGIPIHELMLQQAKDRLRLQGVSTNDLKTALSADQKAYQFLQDNAALSTAELKVKMDTTLLKNARKFPKSLMHGMSADDYVKWSSAQLSSPWTRYYICFNPKDYLTKVKCPVLALNGTLDMTVACTPNLAAIKSALQMAGNNNHQEIALPGLNHLFQKAKTGSEGEYSQTSETMNPLALKTVSTWINQLK